ncbi:hypothetical protein AB1399_02080, partial [Hydrogenibacillus schlegelii]|uniref:hypothetical protein n=1 Tax=Hydrogenibacillus schlegelii TaxID=1484 RepID=UPI0034A017C6
MATWVDFADRGAAAGATDLVAEGGPGTGGSGPNAGTEPASGRAERPVTVSAGDRTPRQGALPASDRTPQQDALSAS